MKDSAHAIYRIAVICMAFIFFAFYYGYAQNVPVPVRSGASPRSSSQVPEDAISLTFRAPKGKGSFLKIEAPEFNNGREVTEGRRSGHIDAGVSIKPESAFLLDVYEADNGVVRVSKTEIGVYATITKIDPAAGENLKCVPLGAKGNVYGRTVVLALIYDSSKVDGKSIEGLLSDLDADRKTDAARIRERMSGVLDHYYLITYHHVIP